MDELASLSPDFLQVDDQSAGNNREYLPTVGPAPALSGVQRLADWGQHGPEDEGGGREETNSRLPGTYLHALAALCIPRLT